MSPQGAETTGRDLARRVAMEHEELHLAMAELQEELGRASGTASGDLVTRMRSFADRLVAHFRLEESGGLLEETDGLDGGTQRIVVKLLAEHRDMEERVARLVEDVERAWRAGQTMTPAFLAGFHGILEDLGAHERAENRLVQAVAYRELGGGD